MTSKERLRRALEALLATCRNNYAAMGWQNKLFVPDPFATPDE